MAEHPPWPGFFTTPEALAAWLQAQARRHRGNAPVQRHLLTLRWLLLAELDRTAPPAPPGAAAGLPPPLPQLPAGRPA